jgi:hypothetical protein
MIVAYERVHIVTFRENYDALKAKGNYRQAGITLVPWASLPAKRREALWKTMLRGKVANAGRFELVCKTH